VASAIPRVLVGAVSGVEIVAVGALQLARDVLLSAVSGAANVGAEAVTGTSAAARGIVSAASGMVGDIVGTAQRAVRETVHNARLTRPGGARMTAPRSLTSGAPSDNGASSSASSDEPLSGPRATRRRQAAGVAGTRAAA
jgi:hypothetical protein